MYSVLESHSSSCILEFEIGHISSWFDWRNMSYMFKCQQTLKLNSNNQFKLVLELACKSVEVSSLKRRKYTDAKKKECRNCSMSQTKIKMIMKNPICPQVGLKLRLFCEEANTTMSVYNNLTLFICNCKCIMNHFFWFERKSFQSFHNQA